MTPKSEDLGFRFEDVTRDWLCTKSVTLFDSFLSDFDELPVSVFAMDEFLAAIL